MTVAINMAKAREVHRNKLRAARDPKMAPLDVAFQRALETGTPTTDIVAKKNELRDVTKHPDIEAAQTLDELKAVWPGCLKE